jgi:hypothetical protein
MRVSLVTSRILLHSSATSFAPPKGPIDLHATLSPCSDQPPRYSVPLCHIYGRCLPGSSRCPIPHQCYVSEHAAAVLLAHELLQAHGRGGIVSSHGETIEPDLRVQGPVTHLLPSISFRLIAIKFV